MRSGLEHQAGVGRVAEILLVKGIIAEMQRLRRSCAGVDFVVESLQDGGGGFRVNGRAGSGLVVFRSGKTADFMLADFSSGHSLLRRL